MTTRRNSDKNGSSSTRRTQGQFVATSSKIAPKKSSFTTRRSTIRQAPSKITQRFRTTAAKGNKQARHLTKRALALSILIEVVFIIALCIRFESVPLILEKAAFGCTLLWLSNTDLIKRIIPNAAIIVAAAIRIVYIAYSLINGLEHTGIIWNSLMGCVVIGIFAFVLSTMTERLSGRAGLGGGDIKLLAVTGLYFGLEGGILILFFACVAALAGYALRHDGSGTFPFGPSIALASGIIALI